MDGAADRPPSRRARLAMSALWPSFLMAGVLEALVFSAVDPAQQAWAVELQAALGSNAIYTLGFLCFWACTALASGLSLLLQADGAASPF